VTENRLIAIRRYFQYGETPDPAIAPQEIDCIFAMAEVGIVATRERMARAKLEQDAVDALAILLTKVPKNSDGTITLGMQGEGHFEKDDSVPTHATKESHAATS
jgi:hypothetical protein